MTIRIRDVRPDDLEAVHALNQDALPAVSDVTLDDMRWFADVAAYFRVADDGERILGFLIGLTPDVDYGSMNFAWFKTRFDSFVYIDRIVIHEKARGCGLGKRFYLGLSDFTRSRAPMITCEVNTKPRNEGSLAFHEKLGFEPVGSQETEGGAKTVQMFKKDVD